MSEDRIEQFRKMTEADPDNELGHFSLGKALMEAGQPADAIAPLQRVLEINSGFSKAWQLLGQAQAATGEKDQAVETLTKGAKVAAERGDRMPAEAMAAALRDLGAEVPAELSAPAPAAGPAGTATEGFSCSRCGSNERMAKPPFKGKLGERIHENVCQRCFREWIPMGTKVINELGLVLSSPEGQAAYDQHMAEFLNLPPE